MSSTPSTAPAAAATVGFLARLPGWVSAAGRYAKLSIVEAASICDGIIKGLKHPEWPLDPWAALKRLMLLTMQQVASAPAAPRGTATPRLQLALNA